MWHEARKQERMIRGLIVDYRRRAERRKDFYEKIKAEPTQFLQLHGRPCKIHLDAAVAAAGEGPAIMMPWQGDSNNMIDRFDVRAHLDFITDVRNPDIPPEELSPEERQCNYERYRILAQNAFLGISEDKFLQQLAIEEQFGVTIEEKEHQKEKLNEKKGMGAAIGYNYNDPGAQPSGSHGPDIKKVEQKDSDEDSDLEIIDVDLSIDVNKMEASQAHELNAVGPQFGMAGCDLFSFLTGDADDAEQQKQLLREEKEKAMFSGRKSRRERRAHRDRRLAARSALEMPAYARARSPPPPRSPAAAAAAAAAAARSRSPSPPAANRVQFITSFGGDDDDKPPQRPLYADKLKMNLRREPLYAEVARRPKTRSPAPVMGPHGPPQSWSRSVSRSRSRSRSRARSRSRSRSRCRSRSRSRSISRFRSRSRSYRRSYSRPRTRSRSRSRSRSRCRSRSRSISPYESRSNYRRRSRSPQNYGYGNRKKSRSMSYESNERADQKPVPRYYGRRKEDKSSSELSLDSASSDTAEDNRNQSAVGNKSNSNQNQIRLSGTSSKGPSRETLSLKEKLRRKMQAQLSRQLLADKRVEAARLERESRRQQRRDQEMRELAIKLRRRQREMRHQQNRRSSDDYSDLSRSRSSSRDRHSPPERNRSRSRTPSPSQEKRIPVWEGRPTDEARRRYDRPPEERHPHNERYSRERRQEAAGYGDHRWDPNRGERGDRWDRGERSDWGDKGSDRNWGERSGWGDRNDWTDRGDRERVDRGDRERVDRGDRERVDRGDRERVDRGDRERFDRGDRERGERGDRGDRGDRNDYADRGDRDRNVREDKGGYGGRRGGRGGRFDNGGRNKVKLVDY